MEFKKMAAMSCVFTEDVITGFEGLYRSERDIPQISNRSCNEIKHRWHPDLNWGMEALQASALPLGHAAFIIMVILFYNEKMS